MKQIIAILLVAGVLFSCGSRKQNTTSSKQQTKYLKSRKFRHNYNDGKTANTSEDIQEEAVPIVVTNTSEYIQVYGPIAVEEMKFYHIPASITLAQGILESGSGQGRLAVEANNHFGIKCHDWTGASINHDDDKDQECFRKYKDAKYSYRDHSLFLTERKRYAGLFELDIDDYKGWAKGLRAAGYATDRKYPEKLIALIERYKLYNYDNGSVVNAPTRVKSRSSQDVHYVVKGDTLYSISKRYNISVQELQKINGLRGTNLSIGQELLVKS